MRPTTINQKFKTYRLSYNRWFY